MKALSFVLILFVITVFASFGQSAIVKGVLIDNNDQSPLPYATISIANESNPNTSIKKLATDDKGLFSTDLVEGSYIISFQFVGMSSATRNLEIKNNDKSIDLGKIEMAESSTELDEVSVVAQRPLVKVEIDKLTYSAKDDPEATTSTVLDMLRKVPLVTVDGDDKIQLKGSSGFKIYLNGKPSNLISNNPSQVLKSMPANSIKDIEVITDPGAKYDAEGVTGIINIITDKRVDEGYSGSVGGNGDTFGGWGGNGYLSLKYGKIGFTGNGSYFMHRSPESTSTSNRKEFAPNPTNNLTQEGKSTSNGGGLYYNTQLSYEPDTLNLFNVSVGQFGGKFKSKSTSEANSAGVRDFYYLQRNNSIGEFGSISASADYQRSFRKKGELLTVSYRFEKNPNDNEFEVVYDKVTGDGFYYPEGYKQKSINDAGGVEHTTQIDYVNPLSKKHNIEAGFKYIFRDNTSRGDNTFFDVVDKTWKDDLSRKNDLDHKQQIASGYAGYAFKANKFGVKVGVRGENTHQNIHFMTSQNDTTVHTDFFDVVPSAAFSYQLGMTETIRWGYNMRIYRPGIWYLNPYINNSNPNNISYGNPNLDAEQSHNFNINYGSFAQKFNFNAALSYSFSRNAITSFMFVDNEGVTHNTYRNIGRNQSIGLNGFASWTPTQMWKMTLNGSLNYTDLQSTENKDLRNSGVSGGGFANVTLTLPKDTRIMANGGLFSQRVQLQTKSSAFYFYSIGAMKSLINKKLDISLNISSPFNRTRKFTSTTNGEGFWQESIMNNPMRNVRLSVTYRFGDLKQSVKRVSRTISNEDLLQGGSSQEGGSGGSGGER